MDGTGRRAAWGWEGWEWEEWAWEEACLWAAWVWVWEEEEDIADPWEAVWEWAWVAWAWAWVAVEEDVAQWAEEADTVEWAVDTVGVMAEGDDAKLPRGLHR